MKYCIHGFTLLFLTLFLTLPNVHAAIVDYQRTIVVSPVGAPDQNGAALIAALDGIVDAAQTNPYLLKIEPGVYDLASEALLMREFVDIEGSGELVTTITSSGQSGLTNATIVGAGNAELRFLTIENVGGNGVATSLYSNGSAPQLNRVTLRAIDDSGGAGRVTAMIVDNANYLRIRNANIVARGGSNSIAIGLSIRDSLSAHITDTAMSALEGAQAYGLANAGRVVNLNNVHIAGRTSAILNIAPDSGARTLRVSHARVVVTGPGRPAIINDAGTQVRLAFCEIDLQGGGPVHSGLAPQEQNFCFTRSRFNAEPFNSPINSGLAISER